MKNIKFTNKFSQLPEAFYTKMSAQICAKEPFLIHANSKVAKEIGLSENDLNEKDFAANFSQSDKIKGFEPLAMVYSGHQFGVWAGQLGDGRALLLGQVLDDKNELIDIQLKGSGKTPYSRFGDGMAVLRSCIREYLASEALDSLKIPTTKALCIVGTKNYAARENGLEPAAIMTRIAKTHIRFGNFEHFYHNNDFDNLKILTDFVITNYFKKISLENKNCYEKFFENVVKLTAKLIAKWQSVGFCHGVMNTDNMSILGQTLDFGPFGFLENFDQNFVCNHSDINGLYSYKNQPSIALWNLNALAISLQPIIKIEKSQKILAKFEDELLIEYASIMSQKLALPKNNLNENSRYMSELFLILNEEKPDYTNCFRGLKDIFDNEDKFLKLFPNQEKIANWLTSYKKYLKDLKIGSAEYKKEIVKTNPKFILRNWIAQNVINEVQYKKNYKILDEVLNILQNPFKEHKKFETFANQAPKDFEQKEVSCSS